MLLISNITLLVFADFGMVSGSGTEDYGRIESDGLLLEVENGVLLDREEQPGVFDLCIGVLSYELKIRCISEEKKPLNVVLQIAKTIMGIDTLCIKE